MPNPTRKSVGFLGFFFVGKRWEGGQKQSPPPQIPPAFKPLKTTKNTKRGKKQKKKKKWGYERDTKGKKKRTQKKKEGIKELRSPGPKKPRTKKQKTNANPGHPNSRSLHHPYWKIGGVNCPKKYPMAPRGKGGEEAITPQSHPHPSFFDYRFNSPKVIRRPPPFRRKKKTPAPSRLLIFFLIYFSRKLFCR